MLSSVRTTGKTLFAALILCCLCGLLLLADPGHALRIDWGRHPQKDRVVLRFEAALPEYSLQRVGPREVLIVFPDELWNAEDPPTGDVSVPTGRFFNKIERNGTAFRILTATEGFRIEAFPLDAPPRLVVDVVGDPGVSWEPEQAADGLTDRIESLAQKIRERGGNDSPTLPQALGDQAQIPEEVSALNATGAFPETRPDTEPAHRVRFQVERAGPDNPVSVPEASPVPPVQDGGADTEPSGNASQDSMPAADPGPDALATEASEQAAPSFRERLARSRTLLAEGRAEQARSELEALAASQGLSDDLRAEVLFALARATFELYRDDVDAHFDELVRSFEAAVNADPDSSRIPWAMLHLGLVHLKADNLPEATGYFNLLLERFPRDPIIPEAYVAYGRTYLDKGAYQSAADLFQHVVDTYPQNDQALPAGVGLATALKELGFFEQSRTMVEFVESRWPRYYLQDPDFLRLGGFVCQQLGDFVQARSRYWKNYNLQPKAPGADIVLTRLGDIYLLMARQETARQVYERAVEEFPDREGGLVAKIRLAEESINDQPTLDTMFGVFDKPFNLRPRDVYTEIIEKHPDSPVAPMAQVKLGIWHVFRQKPKEALELVNDFLKKYPESVLVPRMMEVARLAYMQYAVREVEEKQYERVLRVWDQYPFLQQQSQAMEPQAILSTALSYWKSGEVERAKELAMPYLTGERNFVPDSESALDLVLSIYIEGHTWDKVVELGETISSRQMTSERESQLKYAMALAYENLGQRDKSGPLWNSLANDPGLSLEQQGFAHYFLAKDALRVNDLKSAQMLAQQGLSALLQSDGDASKTLELLDMLVNLSERTGRELDALSWARRMEEHMDAEDQLWPAFRYRLAGLYRNSGDVQAWQEILNDLQSNHPQNLYGRLAASDLKDYELRQKASQFL